MIAIIRITKEWTICNWLAKFIKSLPREANVNPNPCAAQAAAIIEHSPFSAAIIINIAVIWLITLTFRLSMVSLLEASKYYNIKLRNHKTR